MSGPTGTVALIEIPDRYFQCHVRALGPKRAKYTLNAHAKLVVIFEQELLQGTRFSALDN